MSQHLTILSKPAENMYGWRSLTARPVTCTAPTKPHMSPPLSGRAEATRLTETAHLAHASCLCLVLHRQDLLVGRAAHVRKAAMHSGKQAAEHARSVRLHLSFSSMQCAVERQQIVVQDGVMLTCSMWPVRVSLSWPEARSQILMVLSADPVANHSLPGSTATDLTHLHHMHTGSSRGIIVSQR